MERFFLCDSSEAGGERLGLRASARIGILLFEGNDMQNAC